jgi:hypothetical protein
MLGINEFYLYFKEQDWNLASRTFIRITKPTTKCVKKILLNKCNLLPDLNNLIIDYLYCTNDSFCFDIHFCFIDKEQTSLHCYIIPTIYNERKKTIKHLKFLIPHISDIIFNNDAFKRFYENIKSFDYTVVESKRGINLYSNPNNYKNKWLMNGTFYNK